MKVRTKIKPAGPSDLPVLLELMQAYYAYDKLDFDEATALAALRDLLGDKSLGHIWLVCLDNLTIGYIVLTFGYSLEFGGRDAFIDELYVQEAYRGRGIGTKTLDLVESAARSIGIRALHLEVDRGNEGALRFYRTNGFQDRGRFHLMSKRL
jgi:ribosomal protein S18 acetylase RimI-like enzyme